MKASALCCVLVSLVVMSAIVECGANGAKPSHKRSGPSSKNRSPKNAPDSEQGTQPHHTNFPHHSSPSPSSSHDGKTSSKTSTKSDTSSAAHLTGTQAVALLNSALGDLVGSGLYHTLLSKYGLSSYIGDACQFSAMRLDPSQVTATNIKYAVSDIPQPPFHDSKGGSGFEAELATLFDVALSARYQKNFTHTWVPVTSKDGLFDDLLSAVKSGKADVAMSNVHQTDQESTKALFGCNYLKIKGSMVVKVKSAPSVASTDAGDRKSGDIIYTDSVTSYVFSTLSSSEYKVGLVGGSVYDDVASAYLPDAKIVYFTPDTMRDLMTKKTGKQGGSSFDLILVDEPTGTSLMTSLNSGCSGCYYLHSFEFVRDGKVSFFANTV